MSDDQESRKLELAPELVAVQNQLANLTPKALRIDRDQLMFNAGRAAERAAIVAASRDAGTVAKQWSDPVRVGPSTSSVRSGRFWPAATATMTAATVVLSAMLLRHAPSLPIANVVTTPPATTSVEVASAPGRPTFARTWISPPTTGYLGARNTALSRGVGALANEFDVYVPASSKRPEPATARELREELLPTAPRQRG